MKKLRLYRFVSCVILVVMLVTVSTIMFGSKYSYAFSTASSDVIYQGNRQSNKVCLMINVYWGSEYISDILAVLKKHNVKTTFFVGGQWVEKNDELMRDIIADGHEIGSHGYFHCDHSKMDYDGNMEEMRANHNLVKKYGIDMTLFAPPSGAYNKATIQCASTLGYKMIMWSRDTIDWRDKDAKVTYNRATNGVTGGELILMHPTAHTLKALPQILDYYSLNDLVATTVTNTLSM